MRYYINFDKTINQFVPHYLGGRKLILLLQSCLKPLQSVNESFVDWAKETRIEAAMTSQIFKFEWFLNRKFKKYFLNSAGKISIQNGVKLGVPIYHQSADIAQADNMLIYQESEGTRLGETLYYANEKTDESSVSFTVFTPQIDETLITREAYLAMLSYYVDKYRLAGKTYNIKFNA